MRCYQLYLSRQDLHPSLQTGQCAGFSGAQSSVLVELMAFHRDFVNARCMPRSRIQFSSRKIFSNLFYSWHTAFLLKRTPDSKCMRLGMGSGVFPGCP